MPTEFVMLPPQTEQTREWGTRLAAALPELKVVVAENHTHAAQVIAHADAVFGTIPPDLLRQAHRGRDQQRLRARVVLGLCQQVCRDPLWVALYRQNNHLRWACREIDSAIAADELLRCGDVTIAGPKDLFDARNAFRSVSQCSNSLCAANSGNLVNA